MLFTSGTKASITDFTGSFDAGKGTDISTFLINKGAQMILPVAGPQTGDVAGVIATTGNKGNVFTFGVDVDQSKVYNSDYFLGSAIKGIYVSNAYALDQLKKNLVKKPFPQFNMKLKKEPSFIEFTKQMKIDLKKEYSDDEIKTMLKPTGFVPSSIMDSNTTSTANIGDIYAEAKVESTLTNCASIELTTFVK